MNCPGRCAFCGGFKHSTENCFNIIRKEKEKSCVAGDSDNKLMECMPRKCFKCGYEGHLIAKGPKPPKYIEKRKHLVNFSERGNREL